MEVGIVPFPTTAELITTQDPSQELDEAAFAEATKVGAGVFKTREVMMWKNTSAYFRRPGEDEWIPMRATGQWTLRHGWAVYLSGGEIKMQM